MADQMGVGIVGMGWAAGEHFKAFQNIEQTYMRGVSSRTTEGAQRKLDELSAETCVEGVTVHDSYDSLLSDAEIQIVSVCSPPSHHVDHVVAAAEAGKHVVIEKPVALDLAGLRRMQAAVDAAGVKTIVCFELHWNKLFTTLKSLLDMEMIGNVYYAEADYLHGIGPWYKQWAWNVKQSEGGSSLLSAGCHALDAVMWLIGSPVVEVAAFENTGPSNQLEYEYAPNTVTILKFENGVIGKVNSSIEYIGPYYFPVQIHGEEGHIRNNELWSKKLAGQTDRATIPTILPDSGDVTHHPYQDEMQAFVDCILSDENPELCLANAAHVFEVIYAADRSAAEGRVIKMDEFLAQG